MTPQRKGAAGCTVRVGKGEGGGEDLLRGCSSRWATPESRLLSHVILSLPISVGAGSEGYTED